MIDISEAELRRAAIRTSLNEIYVPFYDNLCEALDGTFWVPTSGLRTMDQQQILFDKGRVSPGPIVTHARPGDSAHNWGCATDWAEMRPEFKGEEIWDKANWEQFADAVRGCGLVWGGDFKNLVDKPHAELRIKTSWGTVGYIYRTQGYDGAIKFIGENADASTKGGT